MIDKGKGRAEPEDEDERGGVLASDTDANGSGSDSATAGMHRTETAKSTAYSGSSSSRSNDGCGVADGKHALTHPCSPLPVRSHQSHTGHRSPEEDMSCSPPPPPPPFYPPSSVDTSSVPDFTPTTSLSPTMSPDKFIPLLHCPLCNPPSLLHAPITLHCGHTLCSKHILPSPGPSFLPSPTHKSPLPPCPIPSCPSHSPHPSSSTALALPRHPSVAFIPAPPSPPSALASLFPNIAHSSNQAHSHPRIDVTLNKVLSLVLRSRSSFSPPDDSVPSRLLEHDDEHTDSEDESDSSDGNRNYPDTLHPAEEEQQDVYARDRPRPLSTSTQPDLDLPHSHYHANSLLPSSAHPFGDPCLPRPSQSQSSRATRFSGTHPYSGSRRSRTSPSPPPSRPRKRARHTPRTAAYTRSLTRSNRSGGDEVERLSASARFEKELFAELTCEICFGLMWKPVTTPCQHTFCSRCLHRSLDHNSSCPLCRQQLPEYSYFEEHPCNKLVLAIICEAFPEAYALRGETIEAEERDARLDTPIFVCQLCFPGMPMYVNFYEPKYRLMLRRCLASENPRFGMIPPPRSVPTVSSASNSTSSSTQFSQPGNEFGTMLEIRNVQALPDGQCRVETWGIYRFRILERGTLDGYGVARVERIDDIESVEDVADGSGPDPQDDETREVAVTTNMDIARPEIIMPHSHSPSGSTSSGSSRLATSNLPALAPSTEDLVFICHSFLEQLKQGTPWIVQHVNNAYVPMPEDPAQFSFWMGLLLPIDEHEKAKLLPIRSPRLRLRLVVHWIEQLNDHWAHSYAHASPSQVVLWWLRHFLIRFLFNVFFPLVTLRRLRQTRPRYTRYVYIAYLVVLVAVLKAQVELYRGEGESESDV